MNKTEVYDYLAKIYFDKNKTSGKKEQQPARIKRYLLFLIMALPLVFLGYVAAQYSISLIQPTSYSLYLTTGNNLVEINYDFLESSLETQGYTLGLARLDAKGFKVLQFNARALK